MRFLRKLEREGKQNTVSDLVDLEVTEQEVEMEEVDLRIVDEGGPSVGSESKNAGNGSHGWTQTSEAGSWQEATTSAGKTPTATKRIDRDEEDEEGHEFVGCRHVARLQASAGRGRVGRREGDFLTVQVLRFSSTVSHLRIVAGLGSRCSSLFKR